MERNRTDNQGFIISGCPASSDSIATGWQFESDSGLPMTEIARLRLDGATRRLL